MAATVIGRGGGHRHAAAGRRGLRHRAGHGHVPRRGTQLAGQIAAIRQRFGRADVIENQAVAVPGSTSTYDLRAQDPHGPFGRPMLALVSGHYPAGPGQVAVTAGLAATFKLKAGGRWHQGGQARQVTGIVQNPQSLLDEFALVAPGQVSDADPGHRPVHAHRPVRPLPHSAPCARTCETRHDARGQQPAQSRRRSCWR